MLRTILLTTACAMSLAAAAQMTPRSILTTVPESVMITPGREVVLDLLDYHDAGVSRPQPNDFGEDAVITAMTDSIVTIATGAAHDITFAILPYGKQQIIMAIDRVATPDKDARISFYNSKWEPFDTARMLKAPTLSDWITETAADKREDIENALPFLMVDAQYDPAAMTLTLMPQLGDYISLEGKELVSKSLLPSLTYRWSGKKFKPVR